MTSTFGNILFGGGGKKKGQASKYDLNRKRQERLRKAYVAGRPDALQELPFLKSDRDPWKIERKDRREEVSSDYWREKKRLKSKEKKAENELERQLEKAREDLNRYYNLADLEEGTEEWEKTKKIADKKYELIEGKMTRGHEQAWQDNFHELVSNRGKQYRQVTKGMKREYRRSHGMSEDLLGKIMGGDSPLPTKKKDEN